MPRDFSRSRRVADQVQKELSVLIRDEVKDPRVGMVTVTEVEVSKDLAYAKIFITELGSDAEKTKKTVEILNSAAGFLRKQLGIRIRLRLTPELTFLHDESFERATQLSSLISQAVASDSDSGNE